MAGERLAVRMNSKFMDELNAKVKENHTTKRELTIQLLEDWLSGKTEYKRHNNKDKYLNIRIPMELDLSIKRKVHENNLKMTDVVRDLLEDWLDNQN